MKVLTVKNPWAWLIIYGGKDIENRMKKINYRGRIAIHCSKLSDYMAYFNKGIEDPILRKAFDEVNDRQDEIESLNGKIIGTVNLYNCTYPALTKAAEFNSPWAEAEAAWHYWLKDPVAFNDPIPARGMLGLWEYPDL
jgi:hypothetical protein